MFFSLAGTDNASGNDANFLLLKTKLYVPVLNLSTTGN